jgi:DNA-binding response OmpR family regulator
VRLLVMEDEDRLSGILKSKLGDVGFTVDIAGTAADATAALELINYDAAVLDLGLPDGDGIAVLAAARRIGKALPILILTARDAVEDRVAGLDAGADDYLTKPFAMTELIARIKALLRRPGAVLGITLEAGNVSLDTVGRELTVAGAPVRLSRQELAILEQMMRRFGRIVPKAVMEEKLYGVDEEPDSNPIPVHVPTCGANWRRRAPPWRSTPSGASATSSPGRRREPADQVAAAAADDRTRCSVLRRELRGGGWSHL